jgi:hypothetical protein
MRTGVARVRSRASAGSMPSPVDYPSAVNGTLRSTTTDRAGGDLASPVTATVGMA